MKNIKPKRTYKDSVFADFFGADKSAKSNFISLYNALHGTQLTLDCELRHIRLEQILYMNFYNDVSFLVDNKVIVLAEHQSTVNENMPFRFLEYAVSRNAHPCTFLDLEFCFAKHRSAVSVSEASRQPFGAASQRICFLILRSCTGMYK